MKKGMKVNGALLNTMWNLVLACTNTICHTPLAGLT